MIPKRRLIYFLLIASLVGSTQAYAQHLDVIIDIDQNYLSQPVAYEWGADPFYKTPGYVKGQAPREKFELKAILHSDDNKSLAIINKQTVFVNSVVDGYAVKEIGANYVVIEKGDHLRELLLPLIQKKVTSEISIWDRTPAYDPSANGDEKDDE